MKIKDIEKYIDDRILNTLYKEREEGISEIAEEDKKEISKIKEKYPISYEQLLARINNIPPHFQNIREDILDAIDTYSMRENLLSAYENEKFYKIGFCDGIRIIVENLKL